MIILRPQLVLGLRRQQTRRHPEQVTPDAPQRQVGHGTAGASQRKPVGDLGGGSAFGTGNQRQPVHGASTPAPTRGGPLPRARRPVLMPARPGTDGMSSAWRHGEDAGRPRADRTGLARAPCDHHKGSTRRAPRRGWLTAATGNRPAQAKEAKGEYRRPAGAGSMADLRDRPRRDRPPPAGPAPRGPAARPRQPVMSVPGWSWAAAGARSAACWSSTCSASWGAR